MKQCIGKGKKINKYVPETIGKNNRFNKEKICTEFKGTLL